MAEEGGFTRIETPRTPKERISEGFERLPAVQAEPVKETAAGRLLITPESTAKTYMQKAIEPITSYPSTYQQMNVEARERMGKGVEELGTPGQRMRGAFDVAAGATEFTLSPVNAALRTIVGQPIESVTRGKIKKEWPEFAAALALPGIGLARVPQIRNAVGAVSNVLSPISAGPRAEQAAGLIRGETGTAARDTATTENLIEPFHQLVNKLPEVDRYQFIDYVERRTSGATLPAYMQRLQPIADVLKQEFEKRAAKIAAMPSHAQISFVEDYFPHMWKDRGAAARQGMNYSGVGRQGSGLSLSKRTIPTISDGIGMGLEPISSNPLEMTMRYVKSMDQFIASQTVLETAKGMGTVKYFKPKFVGASGRPQELPNIPDGWVPIKGRGATRADGAQAYAPEDWARIYNNYIDTGIYGWSQDIGHIYDGVRHASNAVTALELGLSGFHAFTMANESLVSEVARGISEIVGGKPFRGLGTISKAPAAPIISAVKGKKLQDIYLGRSMGSPDYRRITELLEKAGGRAAGKSHALDYDFSAAGSYWKSFKRGALKLEALAAAKTIKDKPIAGTMKVAAQQIGRIMDTVAAPLFEKYIPLLKNGAFYDTMGSWLKMHPNATQEQQVAAARQIWDSIDNRFGEMVQDNIFWNKTLKQAATLGMRSYSWNLGTVREIGGGALDIGRALAGKQEWSPRASYVVALPIVVGTLNAAYQYMKTGKAPESVQDLLAGQTGGTAPGAGGRGTVPERISLPGYQKDVLGWYEDWWQEAKNKVATGARIPFELASNRNWRGDPILNPESTAPEWMQQFFNYVGESFGPISLKQMIKGKKAGSAISGPESLMGLGPARTQLQDPEGFKRMMEAIHRREWTKKQRYEKKQERQYGGPSE